jgi:hypothetical protein
LIHVNVGVDVRVGLVAAPAAFDVEMFVALAAFWPTKCVFRADKFFAINVQNLTEKQQEE